VIDDQDDEDDRPGAPLKALDEAKSEETTPTVPVEENANIPPEDAPAFGVVDNTKKKDGTDKYI
jgi:hypothetical protein